MRRRAESGRRLNLLFINAGTDLGGTEIMILRFLERVHKRRFKITVGAFFDRGPLLSEVRRRGFEAVLFPIKHEHNLLEIAYNLARLYRFMRANRFDIVHMNGFYTNILGSLVARMAKIPVVITGVRTEVSGRNGYQHVLERATAHWVDRYISVSEQSRIQMLERPWVHDGQIVVVHNGIDPDWARTPSMSHHRGRMIRARSGVKENSPCIGMIGAFNRLKAQEILILAAPRILRKYPNARFVLAGAGKTKARIVKMIDKAGLSGHFETPDFTLDPRHILARLNVFVLATRTEGLPVSILEAMAFGLPVVASRVGGIPEIVQHGVTGILVNSGDPKAISSAIIELLAHRAKARRMGMRGRSRIARHFHIERMVREMEDHYQVLARSKSIV